MKNIKQVLFENELEFNNTNKFFGKTYIKQKYKNIKSYITTVQIVYLTYEYN